MQTHTNDVRPEGNLRCTAYSLDGSFFAWASPEQYHFFFVSPLICSVKIVDALTGSLRQTLALPNVHDLAFSPNGSFLNTWERPWKNEEDGAAGKNLKVWSVLTGDLVTEFVQKSQNGWNLQYSQDEKICGRNVTNEVHLYESANIQNGNNTRESR
jgi:translation initiation factor 2A